jgi:hypothetical protein
MSYSYFTYQSLTLLSGVSSVILLYKQLGYRHAFDEGSLYSFEYTSSCFLDDDLGVWNRVLIDGKTALVTITLMLKPSVQLPLNRGYNGVHSTKLGKRRDPRMKHDHASSGLYVLKTGSSGLVWVCDVQSAIPLPNRIVQIQVRGLTGRNQAATLYRPCFDTRPSLRVHSGSSRSPKCICGVQSCGALLELPFSHLTPTREYPEVDPRISLRCFQKLQ